LSTGWPTAGCGASATQGSIIAAHYHQRRAPDVCQLRGAYFKVADEPIIFWAALLH
jgi:hypothetical protein